MILTQADLERCQWIAARNDRVLQIVREVADQTGVPFEDIIGQGRQPAVCYARDLACYAARRDGWPNKQIGHVMGRRDASTISLCVQREAARRGEKGR